jgi:hypothetical protein
MDHIKEKWGAPKTSRGLAGEPSRFLFQQKGLGPLFKHYILDFIITVFKH